MKKDVAPPLSRIGRACDLMIQVLEPMVERRRAEKAATLQKRREKREADIRSCETKLTSLKDELSTQLARLDGVLSPSEREALAQELAELNRAISAT